MGNAVASMAAYKGGGTVKGPGTGTSDSVPVRLSKGEFVIPADSVKKIGAHTLHAMVAATHKHVTPKGNAPVRRMANGGLVGDGSDIRSLVAQIPQDTMVPQIASAPSGPPAEAPAAQASGGSPQQVAAAAPPPIADGNVVATGSGSRGQPNSFSGTNVGAGASYVNPDGSASTFQGGTVGGQKPGSAIAALASPSGVSGGSDVTGINARTSQILRDTVAANAKYDEPGAASNGSGMIVLGGPNASFFRQAGATGSAAQAESPSLSTPTGLSANQQATLANQSAIAAQQSATSRANAQTSAAAQLGSSQIGAGASMYGADTGARTAVQRLAQEAPEVQARVAETGARTSQANAQVAQQQRTAAAQQQFTDALKTGDAGKIDAAEMALRGQTGHLPLRYEGGTLGQDSLDRMAAQYVAGDHSVLGNIGRGAQGAQNIAAFQNSVDAYTKANGLKPQDLNANMLNFKGEQAGSVAAGKRTTQLDIAANEAANALGMVREYSAKVPRTEFQPANVALNSFRKNTGDPATVAFGASLNAAINTYARGISPSGTPTVSDKQHAEALLSAAQTPEQLNAVLDVMEREIGAAKSATRDVRQGIATRNGATQQVPGAAPAAAPAAAPPAQAVAPHIQELQRRAQSDPALAERLRSMGY